MFAGGGEKPPEVTDVSGQDDEEDVMVPGFSYGGGPGGEIGGGFGVSSTGGAGGRWWGRDEDAMGSHSGTAAAGAGLPGGMADGFEFRGTPFGGDDPMNSDDFIPGLGAAEHMGNTSPLPPVAPRQSGPLPPQEDMWPGGGGGGGGRNDDWGSGGGGRRGGGGYYERRGGPRRGRH